MKCTECPDYHECHKANDLRRKRGKCKKAKEPLVQTNADHLRAMNDEELAVFLADELPHGDCYDCRLDCTFLDKGKFNDSCKNAWYEWLKELVEVKDDE